MLGRFGVGGFRGGQEREKSLSFDISKIRPVPCFIWMSFSAKKKNWRKKKVGSFVSWIDAVILMLLSGSGGQNQRGREIPRLVFSFPGWLLKDGRCFVELVLVFPVPWPWGGLGSAACFCLSWDDAGWRMVVGALGAVRRVDGEPAWLFVADSLALELP